MSEKTGQDFEELLLYLRSTRGFDFGSYKRATLMRRIQKRMQAVGVDSFVGYLDYLQVHQDEFSLLFNTILINVTGFFRDPESWAYLREKIVPEIVGRKNPTDQIRVWSAGCASGEEAYTLAALLADVMGPDSFRSRVKLYATDLDDEALSQSRQAAYTASELEQVDSEVLKRYFEKQNGDKYVFDRELRRSVIFGRHDLISDAPISRVDLLVCRNTLMYLNSEVQERILARFHFALNEDGVLFLGKAETMLTHGNTFVPLEMKHRIFVKKNGGNGRERLLSMELRNGNNANPGHPHLRLRELALDASPVAQVVIASDNTVASINERARSKFGLSPRDIGRPLQDLELSYKPIELRSVIEQAHSQRRTVTIKEVAWEQPSGDTIFLDVQVFPLTDNGPTTLSTSVTFSDVTEFKRLQDNLHQFNQELETAYEELQSTNEELQTTNEELQSTVEELETTNEELHSTNEELETINEELQSTNEELEAINEELRRTSADLNRTNAFLNSVLASLRAAVIVVDREMMVLAWNDGARDMWGLRQDEVLGNHLLNLDIGLPVDTLRNPIRSVLSEPENLVEYEVTCVNRRGKSVQCKVNCSPLRGLEAEPAGVIVSVDVAA